MTKMDTFSLYIPATLQSNVTTPDHTSSTAWILFCLQKRLILVTVARPFSYKETFQ